LRRSSLHSVKLVGHSGELRITHEGTTVGKQVERQLCVHCRERAADTEDHWLPQSWYPAGSSTNQMLVFPSCRVCNNRIGAVEDRLRSRLALALDPASAAA